MIIDPQKIASLIEEIAAEEIAPRFGNLTNADIDTKTGPNDFVTLADRSAEEKLQQALAGIYPGAMFIGEEGAADDPSILTKLENEGPVWIVDPLDGTGNFVHGRPEFGTIVALVENGETRAGWIYAIPDQAFAIGSKGDGATWRGEALLPVPASDGQLNGYRAIGKLIEPWKTRLTQPLRAAFETEPTKCAAYGYINLIRGLRDFGLYSRCHPWDHAAGIMMLSEIGGRAEYLDDGAAYAPVPTIGRPLLVAGNPENWAHVRTTLL